MVSNNQGVKTCSDLGVGTMDSVRVARSARQSERLRYPSGYPRPLCAGLMRVCALAFIYSCAVIPSRRVSAEPYAHRGQDSGEASKPDFVIRLRDGQTKFHQGEVIKVELGYGADPEAPGKRFPDHTDRPGLAVDRFVLSPHTGVVDPLRDFMSTVGGWDGPPLRSFPYVEAGGAWAMADLNEWFRFVKPGKYILSVFTHPVRTRFEAFGSRPAGAETLKSNPIEFEIVPADEAWQAATFQKALALLESKSISERQREGCRILRFLLTPEAVDKMVEHYADEVACESEYRYGLLAYPDRQYAVRKMENGLLDASTAVSASYLDTLARLSLCLSHPDVSPGEGEQYLGSEWPVADLVELGVSVEDEQERYAQELLGALDNKLDGPRAFCLKALFDSPYGGRPTLLKSNEPAVLAKLRKELAAVFTDLPLWDQQMLLYYRWENIAGPAMIPVLKRLFENPPSGPNEQFISFVLNDLYGVDPAEGHALILAEMKRPRPRLDLRFTRLLPNQEIRESTARWRKTWKPGTGMKTQFCN